MSYLRNQCFQVTIKSNLPEEYFNHTEIMDMLSSIPNTEVIATKHNSNLHEYLLFTQVRRRVAYYEKRITIGEVIPLVMEAGGNAKARTVTVWLSK